jgi:hypothetical protein
MKIRGHIVEWHLWEATQDIYASHSTTCDHHKMWAMQVAGKYSKKSLQKFRADDKVST